MKLTIQVRAHNSISPREHTHTRLYLPLRSLVQFYLEMELKFTRSQSIEIQWKMNNLIRFDLNEFNNENELLQHAEYTFRWSKILMTGNHNMAYW